MIGKLHLLSMRNQIFLLIATPAVLLTLFLVISASLAEQRARKTEWAAFNAGQLAQLEEQIRSADTPSRQTSVLTAARKLGITAALGKSSQHLPDVGEGPTAETIARLQQRLIERADQGNNASGVLNLEIDNGVILRVTLAPPDVSFIGIAGRELVKSMLVLVPILLLAYFASWKITLPLAHIVASAKRISLEDGPEEPFALQGSSEVVSLAASLNAMRSRLGRLIEHRTLVLRSVSHDLRTPLTRLRMRAERVSEADLRDRMLADIHSLSQLIDDTLAYVTNRDATEPARKIDLSSLLQTICSDYGDMGFEVAFSGPRRHVRACKPHAISRAVANVIDNATRYASNIEVWLIPANEGSVDIEVRDDGPGLPEELKSRAIEPFFKADDARTANDRVGFGLGLPIANGIARNLGGTLSLLDRAPHGLTVRIHLPAE